ncbi:glycoside hydrolase family 97 protein [Gaoshiqia sediminis]|uniref:Glycoside hydrolase family 97 protein n=1 Tax=Gaoshiqia sediminis TaxID=2986998 RepID=A0AA41Y5T6_9BACT|nr:glycoside hydrolase family 97 protein [Gaoshiqia sediminis]MCW0482385.1 glycoside hydrolase family 97 protein [Gaoshiqia sediminis]
MRFCIYCTGVLVVALLLSMTCMAEVKENVNSPNGDLQLIFYTESANSLKAFYSLNYKGQVVVQKSEFDIVLDNHLSELAMAIKPDDNYHFINDMKFVSRNDTSVNTSWNNAFGERSTVVDHYNQSSFLFEKRSKPGYQLQIDIRVYNEGVAIRYHFPLNPKGLYYRVMKENTEFVLPEGTKAWYHRWAQAPYELLPLENWVDESERPLTCVLPNGLYASIGEAGLVDYARMKLKLKDGEPGTLVSSLYESVDQITPFSTPWRFILVAETPGQLLENNDMILNLNAPCEIENADWIKPGTIMREIAQSNENSKAQIDFSAENGVDYLLYDWKWYGPAFDFASDASTVSIDLDLQKWIEYGKERGVGIWVYVNQQALLTQMREIFPIYKKWGIKGVKFGFVQVGSHRWTQWLHEAIQLAADNELMVNIHDEFRTTGENRTWPNIMTVEGIRGNEEFPDATHNTILPFTRFVGGIGDYTVCYMDKRLKTTHAHQLALGVVYFSPLQTIYWYDKPEMLDGVAETEYFKNLPTVWDETKVLAGEIGQYAVVARRSGDEWFVGAITNNQGRELPLSFDFLPQGKKYTAQIYTDDASLNTKTNVKLSTMTVSSKSNISANLIDSGGMAIRLIPQD